MADQLELLYQIRPELQTGRDLVKLAKWEGLSFFIFLILISSSLTFLYFRDQKENKKHSSIFRLLNSRAKDATCKYAAAK
jgi:hypothetical protein